MDWLYTLQLVTVDVWKDLNNASSTYGQKTFSGELRALGEITHEKQHIKKNNDMEYYQVLLCLTLATNSDNTNMLE